MERKKKRVLFLCTGNSCRSQMAEGWLRHLAGDRFEAISAGTDPQGIHPLTGESMRERGIEIPGQRSKSVEKILGQSFDFVITVCDKAREICPTFPGSSTSLHWSLSDPAEAKGLLKNNLDISHPIFGPSLNAPQSKTPQHSRAMPRLFLNRSVQIRPKSGRDFVQGIFYQALRGPSMRKWQCLGGYEMKLAIA